MTPQYQDYIIGILLLLMLLVILIINVTLIYLSW
jgi:uncharacterized integral membrane protein